MTDSKNKNMESNGWFQKYVLADIKEIKTDVKEIQKDVSKIKEKMTAMSVKMAFMGAGGGVVATIAIQIFLKQIGF